MCSGGGRAHPDSDVNYSADSARSTSGDEARESESVSSLPTTPRADEVEGTWVPSEGAPAHRDMAAAPCRQHFGEQAIPQQGLMDGTIMGHAADGMNTTPAYQVMLLPWMSTPGAASGDCAGAWPAAGMQYVTAWPMPVFSDNSMWVMPCMPVSHDQPQAPAGPRVPEVQQQQQQPQPHHPLELEATRQPPPSSQPQRPLTPLSKESGQTAAPAAPAPPSTTTTRPLDRLALAKANAPWRRPCKNRDVAAPGPVSAAAAAPLRGPPLPKARVPEEQPSPQTGDEDLCGDLCEANTDPSSRTTLMLRNLPNDYGRDDVLQMLEQDGFAKCFDFFYYPTDFKSRAGLGYAFVNFATHADAVRAWDHFQGFSGWEVRTRKVLEVSWAAPLQGLNAYVERYRNSPVMHESVPEEFRPLLFIGGARTPFPGPTKKVRFPRWKVRSSGDKGRVATAAACGGAGGHGATAAKGAEEPRG